MKKKKQPVELLGNMMDCFTNHDFYQISEGHNLTAHTIGQLGQVYQPKPPRFICRKCGKVIQL